MSLFVSKLKIVGQFARDVRTHGLASRSMAFSRPRHHPLSRVPPRTKCSTWSVLGVMRSFTTMPD